MRGDVLPVLDELVAHLLHGVGAAVAELGQALDDVDDEVEAVELVEHAHVKRRRDRALLDVAADEHVLVAAGVRQLVDELRVAVEGEDDGLVLREDEVVVLVREAVRVVGMRLQLHEVDHVHDAHAHLRQLLAQDGHGGEGLKRRRVAAAGHDDVGLRALVAAGPLPDAHALRAVAHGLLHGQPLRPRMLGGHDDVDIVPAADAVVKAAQEAVCVRRQIDAHDVGLLIRHVVKEAGVLVREAVVVLLPHVRGEHVVERGDVLPPGQLVADLQPLGVLRDHGVHDADEGLVAVEKAVAAGEQVALEPALAHVLREHGVHDAAVGVEKLVVVRRLGDPAAARDLEHRAQAVGGRLVGGEDAEVARVHVLAHDVAHERAEHGHVLRLDGAGRRHGLLIRAEVRHAQLAQQQAAVGVGVRAHAALPLRREGLQLGDERAVVVKELLGVVAAQPLLELHEVLGLVHRDRHLVRAERPLHLPAVHFLRAGPALRRAEHDHRPVGARGVVRGARVLLDGVDLLDGPVHRLGHFRVHFGGVVALDEARLPPAAAEEHLELLVADAGKERGVGDLEAVEVQDRQHRAVRDGVDELVAVPRGGERAGLGLAVADDAGGDEVRVIHHGAEGVRERVAQLAALVDGARRLGRDMARDAAGERKLLEQALHAGRVARDVRVHVGVRAVEIVLRDHGVAAVARAGEIDHVEVVFVDDAVEVRVDEVLAGHGAPVADDLLLDVALGQPPAQQRVVEQVELAGGQIIRRAPPGVHLGQQLRRGCKRFVFHRGNLLI